MGLWIIVGRCLPSGYVNRFPAPLGALGVGALCIVFQIFENGTAIEAAAFFIFHVAAFVKFEDHEPVGIVGYQHAQFVSAGNVLCELQHLFCAGFAGKAIAFRDVDLSNVAQLTGGRTNLPVNMNFRLFLLLCRFLRRCRRQECEQQ